MGKVGSFSAFPKNASEGPAPDRNRHAYFAILQQNQHRKALLRRSFSEVFRSHRARPETSQRCASSWALTATTPSRIPESSTSGQFWKPVCSMSADSWIRPSTPSPDRSATLVAHSAPPVLLASSTASPKGTTAAAPSDANGAHSITTSSRLGSRAATPSARPSAPRATRTSSNSSTRARRLADSSLQRLFSALRESSDALIQSPPNCAVWEDGTDWWSLVEGNDATPSLDSDWPH